jgi:signal transduction histidine kinase
LGRVPRSLLVFIAASSVYAALLFLVIHAIYGIELGRIGAALGDPLAHLSAIDAVSFAFWIGLSMIASTVVWVLARSVEGARGESAQRQDEMASIFALGQTLTGSLELDGIAQRFLATATRSLGDDVSASLYVQDETTAGGFRIAGTQGPLGDRIWPQMTASSDLPGPIRTRVVDHRQAIVIPDTAGNDEWARIRAATPTSDAVRSFAALPLVSHDRLVGMALLVSTKRGALTHDGVQMVALGTQFVASAVRTALTLSEAEARANREAIVNRVAQRARAAHEPDAVVEATVDELARALRVRRVGVSLGSTPDDLRIAHSWTRDASTPPATLLASQQAAATGRTAQITDESASRLATPIVIGGELAGVLTISDEPAREWSIDDVRLVEAVARELRGAIEAARLLQSRQHENERLLALQRASTIVAARSTTRDVIDEVLHTASTLFGEASASLYLWDEQEKGLRLAQNADRSGRSVGLFLGRGDGKLGDQLTKLEPIVVNDYPSWSGASAGGLQHGLKGVIAVPLVRAGTLLGAIVIRSYDERTRFTLDDARLLGLFGDQAVAALANAEAFERQRRAVEQLERVNRAKSEFVSIVSHEFRTPLTGIQGFSEMMRDEDLAMSEMKEYAADINKDAQRLNRMINEMLDLDRMEAGRLRLNREQLDLNATVADAVARVRPNAPGHPIMLVLDPMMPSVSADRDRLTQIVANLLSNAVKYSPTGGEIVVTTARDGDGAHLSVSDHGMGIPAEMLESIWERYSRVESDKTRGIQGTGLGLAIVRQIVNMHGGRVWAESEVGRGSTFHVILPLAASGRPVEA